MIRAARSIALVIGVTLGTAPPLLAQTQDVGLWKPIPAHEASYESVTRRHRHLIDTWNYGALYAELANELESNGRWPANHPIRANLLTALREMSGRFAKDTATLTAADDEKTKLALSDNILKSRPTGLFQLVAETWFSGRPFAITVPDVETLPPLLFQDFMHRMTTAERLLRDMAAPNRAVAVAAIEAAAQRWRQYLFDGRSQYPWEIAFNEWTTVDESDIQQPPRRQFILFHPEVGVELGTRGAGVENVSAKETAIVQALGHVWYLWPGSASGELRWIGLSGTLSMRENERIGFGFTAHYGKVVNVGVLWRDISLDGTRQRTRYFHTGLDLFRLARKSLPGWLTARIDDQTKAAAALPAPSTP